MRGTTEAINLVAKSLGPRNIGAGDEIVVTLPGAPRQHRALAAAVPRETGAQAPRRSRSTTRGQVLLDEYEKLLDDRDQARRRSRQVSNALGTVTPVHEIDRAGPPRRRPGAGRRRAVGLAHARSTCRRWTADFFVFSGHKVFGPTGIGARLRQEDAARRHAALAGRRQHDRATSPSSGRVYQAPPARFEAGTGNIADAVGLGAALDYVERIGIENIARYEHELLDYAHGAPAARSRACA